MRLDPQNTLSNRPSMAEAEVAVRTLIRWAGDIKNARCFQVQY